MQRSRSPIWRVHSVIVPVNAPAQSEPEVEMESATVLATEFRCGFCAEVFLRVETMPLPGDARTCAQCGGTLPTIRWEHCDPDDLETYIEYDEIIDVTMAVGFSWLQETLQSDRHGSQFYATVSAALARSIDIYKEKSGMSSAKKTLPVELNLRIRPCD